VFFQQPTGPPVKGNEPSVETQPIQPVVKREIVERSGQPERRIVRFLKSTVLGRRRVTLVVRRHSEMKKGLHIKENSRAKNYRPRIYHP